MSDTLDPVQSSPSEPISPFTQSAMDDDINTTIARSASENPISGHHGRIYPDDTPSPLHALSQTDLSYSRGLSRSSSVPRVDRHLNGEQRDENSAASSFPAPPRPGQSKGTRHNTSSVKHLTCFWWKEKGSCRFSDDDCLYAHRDTGHYTDPPRQLVPGEPALAGRKLDRAMRNLAIAAHRSSGSLSGVAGSRHPSRPTTPLVATDTGNPSAINLSSPLTSPLAASALSNCGTDHDITRLSSDNQFLRSLVDQNGKEKAILINTIEALQAESKCMKGELEGLRKAQEQLLNEREGLHERIGRLEAENSQKFGATRSVSNPFGAIGRGRINTEARYLGGLLTDE